MKKIINKLLFDDTNNGLIQFIRYFFVGGIAAVVNIGSLYIFSSILLINYIVGNIFAFILGLVVNYLLSKKYVFTKSNSLNKFFEFVMYSIIGVLGLLFDTFMLWLFTSKIGLYYMLSKIISTMLTFVWNFLARKILYKIFDR